MRMKIPFTGGCVCGAVRYECSAEPIMTLKCHCRDCQQVTGGALVFAARQETGDESAHAREGLASFRVALQRVDEAVDGVFAGLDGRFEAKFGEGF